tara:strand:+ start:1092 stop:6785 length:5694 start_codon:yes stop_codon:yes gene_type:complete
MAKCPNKNTAEYKALQNVYVTELATNNIIISWQDLNNTDVFPTVLEAKDFVKTNKMAFALKQKNFGESILNNLRREKIIHQYQDIYLVNNSNPQTREYDEKFLQNNLDRLVQYLEINNIPLDSISTIRTPMSYKVKVKPDVFTNKDLLPSSRSWDTNRSRAVVGHLMRMFPQVKVEMMSVSEAQTLYDKLPQWRKTSANFSEVNSFYFDGTAYLIRGRVTDETAIEEMLHPFIDAIKVDNPELFNGLLVEAKKNFPELTQQINDAYNKKRNFTQLERDLELVTQALTRHFKNEYETTPTKSFLKKIQEALDWFLNVIKDLGNYIESGILPVTAITNKTSFSDLAKLLNTEGIRFKLESVADSKIRYSLTPEKQKVYNSLLKQAEGNITQTKLLKQMFHSVVKDKSKVDSLSVNVNVAAEGNDIVVLNKKDNQYVNITTGELNDSAVAAVKGSVKNEEQIELNSDIKSDINTLLDVVVSQESIDSVINNMNTLNSEQATKIYSSLKRNINFLKSAGSIAIPQVVVFDNVTKLANTADLLIMDPTGALQVISLRISKNSVYAKSLKEKVKGVDGKALYENNKENLPEDSLLKQKGVDSLSVAAQDNLEVNMMSRMLENMGYKIQNSNAMTFHYISGVSGKKGNEKFNGDLVFDDYYQHPISENRDKVNLLIPSQVNNFRRKQLNDKIKNDPDQPYVGRDDESVNRDEAQDINYQEYTSIFDALGSFKEGLIAKLKAIELIDNKIFLKQGEKVTRDEISRAIGLISLTMGEGSAERSRTYTAMLRYALREMREFQEYVEDPKNISKPEYIRYVMNFNRFISTYQNLFQLSDITELNATQSSMVLQLETLSNKIAGTKKRDGLVNIAIVDFVTEQVRGLSNKEFGADNSKFTEEDLKEIVLGGGIEFSRDIDIVELLTKDMSTSGETLLTLMDKIYKRQKQILLNRIGYREEIIRKVGEKVLKLSPSSDKQEIFRFMLEYDSDDNFSGFYTKKIGQRYYGMAQDLYKDLSDINGTPFQYNPILNLRDGTAEEIAYNIDLANKKKAYSDFMKAEIINEDGSREDGTYHKYTEEFINARNRFEYLSNGYWLAKTTNDLAEYTIFKSKYYENRTYTKALRDEGVPTGAIILNQEYNRAVKNEFVEPREISGNGEMMRSDKYEALYDPTKTDALTLAQREFYELYIQFYEDELLNKIPEQQKAQMLGKVPLVRNQLISTLKKEGSLVTRLYASSVRSWKNLTEKTASEKTLLSNEDGSIYNGLPVMFTGSPSVDGALEVVEAEIAALKDDYKQNKIAKGKYIKEKAILNGKASSIRNRPSLGQVSTDMASSLLEFSKMAEHYEVMGEIEDTLNAFVKVISQKEYQSSNSSETWFEKGVNGVLKSKGFAKTETGTPSNVEKRARKYMSMIFYDNDLITKGAGDRIAAAVISTASLTYVAFNPLGNFNNYAMGRINNGIEMLGQRYFSKSDYIRASKEYNTQGLQSGIFQRLGAAGIDLADIATLGKAGLKTSTYDPELANNLYEGLVDDLRMMDPSSDLRESGNKNTDNETVWQRFTKWGYTLQDAAEYNVQTKVGMAILMGITVRNSKTNETLSYYDAHVFDTKTHKPRIKEGFDEIVSKNGNTKPINEISKAEITQEIREVNKQIHGNYSSDDKMVLQSYMLGNFAAQFKKWVAPAIRSRFQRQYFDENLGHMEGRYRSWWKFVAHATEQIFKGNKDISTYKDSFLKEQGFTGEGGNRDQFATNKILGVHRSMGELGIILSVMAVSLILDSVLIGDDDDDPGIKKLKNALKKQSGRLIAETTQFVPLFPATAYNQLFGFIDKPFAATKNVSNMLEALLETIHTPYGLVSQSEAEFYTNSKYVYQRGYKKGTLKLWKEWKDAIPILYTIQKWNNLIDEQEYNIRY